MFAASTETSANRNHALAYSSQPTVLPPSEAGQLSGAVERSFISAGHIPRHSSYSWQGSVIDMTRYSVWATVVIVLIMTIVLGGCPKAPTESDAASGPAATPVKLNLWTIWNTEPRISALQAIVDQFQQQNPGIQIQVTALEPDAYKTRIGVALGSSAPPDIYFVWSGEKMLRGFIRGGNTADLTEYMQADDAQWQSRIVPASLEPYVHEGRIWGIPFLLQCTFFFYNTEMFDKHGWEIPETWDELVALCRQIKAAGITPIALGNVQKWPAHHFPFVLSQRLLGKQACDAQFDPLGPGDYSAPEFVRALEMFADFYAQGFFNDSPNGTTRENARALFYSGKTAMFYTGTWDLSRLVEGGEAPEEFWDKWDFFDFPALPGGKGNQHALAGSPDGYVISSATPHLEQAVAFLKFMTTVEQARGFVDACQELVQVMGAVSEDNAGPRLAKYARIVEQAEEIAPWMDTMMEASVADEYMNGVQALLDGRMTPKQIMEAVRQRQARVKEQMLAAEQGEPGAGE
jgi:raffinose/stachyose/melibiose transport system substrate-binding protein